MPDSDKDPWQAVQEEPADKPTAVMVMRFRTSVKDLRLKILARRENRGRLILTVKDKLSGLSWAMKTPWKSRQISKG
jgi:hypothetical protein